MCCAKKRRRGLELLTVGVVLLPDSIHSPVRLNPQEEAPVFTVQPFGILEAPRRKPAAAAVFRCGGKCCDFSRGHLLLFPRFPATASSPSWADQSRSPTEASHLPLSVACSLLPPHRASQTDTASPQRSVSLNSPLSGQQVPSESWGKRRLNAST